MYGVTVTGNIITTGTGSATVNSGATITSNILTVTNTVGSATVTPGLIVNGTVTTGGKGDPGAQGSPGVGVPVGGTTNQVLAKTSAADYATSWKTITNITVSATAPSSPAVNDLWLNTA